MENKKNVLSEENINPENAVTEGEIADEATKDVAGGFVVVKKDPEPDFPGGIA